MNKQLKGVFPVLITPMNEDFSVNYDGMKENVKHYLEQKVSGIVIVGSTGDSPAEEYDIGSARRSPAGGRLRSAGHCSQKPCWPTCSTSA